MTGIPLWIPFFCIRFLLLAAIGKKRGAFRHDGEPQAVRLPALSGGGRRAAFLSAFSGPAGRCCVKALLLRSPLLLAAVLAIQLAGHFAIFAEKRRCLQKFGADYAQYMKKVRRYF